MGFTNPGLKKKADGRIDHPEKKQLEDTEKDGTYTIQSKVRHNLKNSIDRITDPPTILVVDDDHYVRRMLIRLLGCLGYKVVMATNGLEAVNAFQKSHENVDLILLDVNMPVMDGREAFYEFRKINPEIKILVFTGFTKDHVTKELEEMGADLIQKPFCIEEIKSAIKRNLKKSEKP